MLETAQPSGGAATRQSAAQVEQYKVDPYSQVSRRGARDSRPSCPRSGGDDLRDVRRRSPHARRREGGPPLRARGRAFRRRPVPARRGGDRRPRLVRLEPEDVFFVTRVTRGALRLRLPGGEEDFDPGDVALLGRPGVAATSEVHDYGQLVTTLRAPTIREAAGLAPSAPLPTFASVRPISPTRARSWIRARDFVNGLVIGDPEVTGAPLVVGSADRMLAGLLLATFPNTAIAPPSRIPPASRHDPERLPAQGAPRPRPRRAAHRLSRR
jgi:hypothetical protein